MRCLDLDLDFFLNKNAYHSGDEGGRLGPDYKPWRVSRVRRFLEDRCGLSPDTPVPGRTVASHDGVLEFWRALIDTGRLRIPFEVIHIDAHPDLWAGNVLYRTAEYLYIDLERGLALLKQKSIHEGNYLTFAIAYGWVGSLVWIPILEYRKKRPEWDADARSGLIKSEKRKGESTPSRELPAPVRECCVHYEILPWSKFRTSETFDYIALSKSPDFTPPESDVLIPVIEEYMKQI